MIKSRSKEKLVKSQKIQKRKNQKRKDKIILRIIPRPKLKESHDVKEALIQILILLMTKMPAVMKTVLVKVYAIQGVIVKWLFIKRVHFGISFKIIWLFQATDRDLYRSVGL